MRSPTFNREPAQLATLAAVIAEDLGSIERLDEEISALPESLAAIPPHFVAFARVKCTGT